MIDEEWLDSLRFVVQDGIRVEGLAGVGNDKVVFNAIAPDGSHVVITLPKDHLGFFIRELPLFLTGEPQYNVNRVNLKLYGLLGNPVIDSIVFQYECLYSKLVYALHYYGIILVLSYFDAIPGSSALLPFILRTTGIRHRLEDLAYMNEATGDPPDITHPVNGQYPIDAPRQQIIERARYNLEVLQFVPPVDEVFDPEGLAENPLYIWGGAAMDGFFTDAELPQVVEFIEKKFGKLSNHPKMLTWLEQASALSNLVAQFLNDPAALRLANLCAKLGFLFPVIDREGTPIWLPSLVRYSQG